MKYTEKKLPQYWIADNGQVHSGIHIQVIAKDGTVVGETGWINATLPEKPKIARLELVPNPKFEIFTHINFRSSDEHIGTDLLRMLFDNVSMNAFELFMILDATSSAMPFYRQALSTLTKDGLVVRHSNLGIHSASSASKDIFIQVRQHPAFHQIQSP